MIKHRYMLCCFIIINVTVLRASVEYAQYQDEGKKERIGVWYFEATIDQGYSHPQVLPYQHKLIAIPTIDRVHRRTDVRDPEVVRQEVYGPIKPISKFRSIPKGPIAPLPQPCDESLLAYFKRQESTIKSTPSDDYLLSLQKAKAPKVLWNIEKNKAVIGTGSYIAECIRTNRPIMKKKIRFIASQCQVDMRSSMLMRCAVFAFALYPIIQCPLARGYDNKTLIRLFEDLQAHYHTYTTVLTLADLHETYLKVKDSDEKNLTPKALSYIIADLKFGLHWQAYFGVQVPLGPVPQLKKSD